MYALYGVATHSAATLIDKLADFTKGKVRITLFEAPPQHKPPRRKWFKREYNDTHVLIFLNVQALRSVAKYLVKAPVVAIVHDNPVQLSELQPIKLLDTKRTGLSFIFSLRDKLPLQDLDKSIQKAVKRQGNHIDFAPQQFQIIPNLIEEQLRSGILHLYNTITLGSTKLSYRATTIDALLRRLFGEITKEQCGKLLADVLPEKGKAREFYQNFEDYLAQEKGKSLLAALADIRKQFGQKRLSKASGKEVSKAISYDSLAKKYDVEEPYDLRYLTLAYRKFKQERSGHKVSAIASRYKPKDKAKRKK